MSPRGVYPRKPRVPKEVPAAEPPAEPVMPVTIEAPPEPEMLERPAPATKESNIQRHETCAACRGNGMVNVSHAPVSGQGDPAVRMETCRNCMGSGVDRNKPLEVAAPASEGVEVSFGDVESHYRVVTVALPAVMKPWGKKPGWGRVFGVIAKGVDATEPSNYRGLFPSREGAESFAQVLEAE